jgi:moderate conductance mechanosensitive channel
MPIVAFHADTFSRESLVYHGVRIAVIVGLAFLILIVSRLAVRRMQRRLEGVESVTQELDLQRSATLTQAVSYAVRVAVWTVAVLLVVGELGISLGPLIAGAGIVGVALGFGAQSLVRDYLSGFFMLLENQLGVGDGIELMVSGQMVTGKVEAVSLRTTELRAYDGTLHIVPNGNVLLVSNKSRGWARVIVDVAVAFGEDLGRVRTVLEELFAEIKEEERFQGAFFTGPEMLGLEKLGSTDVVVRVVGETRPSRRGDLERELRARIKQRFIERGIEVAAAPPSAGAAPAT